MLLVVCMLGCCAKERIWCAGKLKRFQFLSEFTWLLYVFWSIAVLCSSKSLFCSDLYFWRSMQVWSNKWAVCLWKVLRVPTELVEATDICVVCSIDDIQVGLIFPLSDTWCLIFASHKFTNHDANIHSDWRDDFRKNHRGAIASVTVEEPTVRMAFSINISPFMAREVYGWSFITVNE